MTYDNLGTYGDYLNGYTDCSSQGRNTDAYAQGSQDELDGVAKKTLEQFYTWVASQTKNPATSSGAQREKLHTLPYDLVPFQEIVDAHVRVSEHGAQKYAPWNWTKGLSRVQLIGSLLRHTFAYLRGEDYDKDSKLLHTDHILWNASALSHNVHHGLEDGRRVEPEREYKK